MISKAWNQRGSKGLATAEAIARIENRDLLIERFGGWPTFEDAEVLKLEFDRGNHWWVLESGDWSRRIPPSLVATFFVFDSRFADHAPERKPSSVSIRFEEFQEIEIEGFNHQNPVLGVGIELIYSQNLRKEQFFVDWGGCGMTHEVLFVCDRIRVLSVEPMIWSNTTPRG
jgi:hypothetical protein